MNVAEHIRIFEVNPSDDFATKREAAIRDIAGQYLKLKTMDAIFGTVETILAGSVNGTLPFGPEHERIAAAIKKQSASFVSTGRDLEIGISGLLALGTAILGQGKANERLSIIDAYAVSAWSALSFLPSFAEPKLERLRQELIERARSRIQQSGLELRERRTVAPFKGLGEAPLDDAKFAAATKATIDALRFNAALDREEIDILWWVLSAASSTHGKAISELSPTVSAVTAGFELGQMMRTLPGDAHRNLVYRTVREAEGLSLAELLESLGEERHAIADAIGTDKLPTSCPLSFPVLNAILTGTAAGPGATIKRPLKEWAARTLLESAIIRLQWDKSSQL